MKKGERQEQCNHDWQTYEQCCYCGAFNSHTGKIIEKRTQGNVEAIRNEFMIWWDGVKEHHTPLAMQVFHWFDTHVGIFDGLNRLSDRDRIWALEKIVDIKEKERQEWADMCIKKQARIEELERGYGTRAPDEPLT